MNTKAENVIPLQSSAQTRQRAAHDVQATASDDAGSGNIRAALREAMADGRTTQARIARECGISASALNQWLAGKYTGDNAALESLISRWLAARRERQQAMQDFPQAPDYIATLTGETILRALKFAQFGEDISIIYGAAGVGKTAAIMHYAATMTGVFVVTMTPATAGVVPALEEIALTVGADVSAGGAARLHRAILSRLRATSGLLIIDEAQHLNPAALDQIRAIHDATGVGIALVGNEQVFTRMTGGTRAAAFDRLFRRIGKRVRVTRATDNDATALADAWGVTDAATRAALCKIAGQPGALRGATKALRMACAIAATAKRRVTVADVQSAWRELCGEV
jgi:DNA transposition AAA+ family ATPase